jgi:hypothetical protein
VQHHDIKGHDVEQFREPNTLAIFAPEKHQTGGIDLSLRKGAGA